VFFFFFFFELFRSIFVLFFPFILLLPFNFTLNAKVGCLEYWCADRLLMRRRESVKI